MIMDGYNCTVLRTVEMFAIAHLFIRISTRILVRITLITLINQSILSIGIGTGFVVVTSMVTYPSGALRRSVTPCGPGAPLSKPKEER